MGISVDTAGEKAEAAQAVRALDGVREVRNPLQVVAPAAAKAVERSDDAIEIAVRTQVDSRADLEAGDSDVAVANGIAQLTGSVPSQDEGPTAWVQTRAVVGVRSVIDEVTIVAD